MPSKRSSARQLAAAQHEFLVDRSLGRIALVSNLRSVGLIVRTLADVYVEEAAQETQDTEWIRLAAQEDWIVLCKDDRIVRRPAEHRIIQVARKPGPYLYGVYKDTVKRLWPPEA